MTYLFAIRNLEVFTIEGTKCIGIYGKHSVLPKQRAIKLKGESVKGDSTVLHVALFVHMINRCVCHDMHAYADSTLHTLCLHLCVNL